MERAAPVAASFLEPLFHPEPLIADTDGDGYPDTVRLRIVVPPNLVDPHIWVQTLHLAARSAFEVTALDLPLVSTAPPREGPALVLKTLSRGARGRKRPNGLLVRARREASKVVLEEKSAGGLARFLELLALTPGGWPASPTTLKEDWSSFSVLRTAAGAWSALDEESRVVACWSGEALPCGRRGISVPACGRPRRGKAAVDILDLAGPAGCYTVPRYSPRAKKLRLSLLLPSDRLSPDTGLALSDAVVRLALEGTELELPLVSAGAPLREDLLLEVREEDADASIRWIGGDPTAGCRLLVNGRPRDIARLLRNWIPWALKERGPGSAPMDGIREGVFELQHLVRGEGYEGRWLHALVDTASKGKSDFKRWPAVPADRKKRVARACEALGLPVPATLTPPPALRRRFTWRSETEEILRCVQELAAGEGELHGEVFVSKPREHRERLRRALEDVLRSKGFKARIRVRNAYKPGLAWLLDEILPALQGAFPPPAGLEVACRPFSTRGAIEMRSRWVQELFPGPDLLARTLGLGEESVTIRMDSRQRPVYRFTARDASGRVMLEESLTPRWSRLPYILGGTRAGWVHPATGGIRLRQGKRLLLDHAVPTDRERFWGIFRNRWLRELEARMEERLGDASLGDRAAFWEEVRVEVAIDETEIPLGLDEERVAPMEALHEDLYFGLLEFYADFAKRHRLPERLRFGRIVPVVVASAGGEKPRARFSATPHPWPELPGVVATGRPNLEAIGLRMKKGRWGVTLGNLPGTRRSGVASGFVSVLRVWGFDVETAPDGLLAWFPSPRESIPEASAPPAASSLGPPPADRVLTSDETQAWVDELGRRPYFAAWTAARSFAGRPIRVLEARLQREGSVTSQAKARMLRPTVLFNARHHANEVSSTGAALRSAWKLATSKDGETLLRHVNLVWIPMENVDGVATFEELHPGAPGHKLHAARYNALGSEFYADYFEPRPRFPEAWAKSRLWWRWFPEIMIDGHGVPSHEWDQPFSGVAPPGRFAEHWIPRTFLYVYIPFLDEERHPGHETAKKLAGALKEAVAEDDDLTHFNRRLQYRYLRYAREWEPEVFPPVSDEPLVVLPPVKGLLRYNFAVRYPDVTSLEIVTEVADEVVSGPMLERCVRAHETVLRAVIDWLRKQGKTAIKTVEAKDACLSLVWRRRGHEVRGGNGHIQSEGGAS